MMQNGRINSQIIGSLMYLASVMRPHITFFGSKLSRFFSKLGDVHWHAVERVMRYLKGTMNYGLHYTGYPSALEGYSDANWISDADEVYVYSWRWRCLLLEVALFPGSLASKRS